MSRRASHDPGSVEDRLHGDIASLEEKLREQLVEKKACEAEISKLKLVNEKLSQELGSVSQSFDDLVESSKEMERELESEVAMQKQQLSVMQIRLEQATKMYQSAQQSVSELQQQVAALTAKKDAAEKKVQRLEVDCESFESKARRFESSYDKLAGQYNDALQQVALLAAEVDTKTQELRTLSESAQRAKIEAQETAQTPTTPPKKKGTDYAPSLLAYAVLAAVVSYIGFSMFKKNT